MKKIAKIAGNLLMICAVAFLIKKVVDMDADLSQLLSPEIMGAFGINLAVQTLLVVVGCIPWMVFAQSLSGKKIPFSSAMPVYTKSNVYKYLPGNVFQYVGRNKLAFDMNISHIDVACATILDILFCVFWTGVISVVLLGSRIAGLRIRLVDLQHLNNRLQLLIDRIHILIPDPLDLEPLSGRQMDIAVPVFLRDLLYHPQHLCIQVAARHTDP